MKFCHLKKRDVETQNLASLGWLFDLFLELFCEIKKSKNTH